MKTWIVELAGSDDFETVFADSEREAELEADRCIGEYKWLYVHESEDE